MAAIALAATCFLLSLIIDPVPRFHLEDSADFLLPGFSRVRSWTYGTAISFLISATGRLASVPVAQIILTWCSFAAFLTAVTRATYLKCPLLFVFLVVGCCEPLAYYWSHAIMADSVARAAFALVCAVLLMPLRPRLRFALVFLAALVLISFRVVYFPALAAAAAVAVAWQIWRRRNDAVFRPVALAAILSANLGYACANTLVTQSRVLSTNISDMDFLVGALSPLMGDELGNTPLTPAERSRLLPLVYENRLGNTFNPHGLVPLILSHFSSIEKARLLMRQLVVDSVRRHPAGFVRLVLRQWGDYLNPVLVIRSQEAGRMSGAVAAFRNDRSVILPDSVVAVLRQWHVRPAANPDLPSQASPALTYLEEAGGVWSLVLAYYATFSLLFVAAMPARCRTPFLVFINSFAFLYLMSIAIGANELVSRYLLPLDVPLAYTIAVALDCARRRDCSPAPGKSEL